jgi:hypothetical protein
VIDGPFRVPVVRAGKSRRALSVVRPSWASPENGEKNCTDPPIAEAPAQARSRGCTFPVMPGPRSEPGIGSEIG